MIELWVHGAFAAVVEGVELAVPSRRGRALLAYLAVEARPVPREVLAGLLWGPGRLQNLRQELYRLRRLPGADRWLVDGEVVAVRAALRSSPARGPLLDGLEGVGGPALAEWVAERRTDAPGSDLEERLLRVLAHAPELGADEVADVLGASREALATVWDRLARGTDLPAGVLRPALGAAIRRATPPPARELLHKEIARRVPRVAAEHLEAAGADAEAARAWLLRGRATGDLAAMGRAAALAIGPSDRAAALEALVAAGRRLGDPAVSAHAAALAALARDSQHPAAVVADAFVATTLHLDRGDVRAAERAARELAHAALDADDRARAAVAAAAIALRAGRYDDALAALDGAEPASAAARVLVDNARGAALAYLGDLEGADHHHRAALRAARESGDRLGAIGVLNSLAATDDRRGATEDAFARVDEAAGLAGRGPLAVGLHHNRGVLALRLGRLGVLRDSANQLLDAARRLGAQADVARAMHLRGALELELGRAAEAGSWFARAAEAHGAGDVAWAAIHAFNQALAAGDDPAPALDRLRAVGRVEVWRDALLDVAVHGSRAGEVDRALTQAAPLGGGPEAERRRAYAAWRLGGPAPAAPPFGREGWRAAAARGDRDAAEAWLAVAEPGLLPAQVAALREQVRRAVADPDGLRPR